MTRRRGAARSTPADGLVGQSAAIETLRGEIEAFAAVEAPVLLLGETGPGKELVAAALHRRSRRAGGRFEPVNCGQLSAELLGAQLFGHERGAFTGAVEARPGLVREASGGTLFLDEVGDLVPAGQAALLRFLDSGEVRVLGGRRLPSDVRIVAATNRDLLAAAWQGTFKPDLWYRLGRLVLRLPPLRERLEDLPLLVDHLVARLNAAHGLAIDGVTSDALARLAAHPWPGNVRELQTVLERAMVLQRTGRVPARGLRFDPLPPAGLAPASTGLAWGGGAGDPAGSGRPGPPTAGRPLPASQRPSVALELARVKGQLTRQDLVLRGGFTADTARQTLTELARAGQLHRSGRGRAVHYVPVDRR